jgi:NAD/NADP transhydrogenase beta subunit
MRNESGQAMVESLALAVALAVALLLPVGGARPVAIVLLEAIVGFLRAQAFVLSIV